MLPVSVVLQIYNSEAFLNETIESVLNQTFNNFELIIADNGSTDRSREIVLSYKDPRIRYVFCKHDFIGTYRKGYKLAAGKYIAHLDHDDKMAPERLQIQFDFMESHPEIDACGGYMYAFGKYSRLMAMPYLNHDDMAIQIIEGMPVHNPTGFFRKEFLTRNKIMPKRGYSFAADYKFWADIAKAGKIANIPQVLTYYRTSDTQTHIVHRTDMLLPSWKVQNEMIAYFISKLNPDSEIYKILMKKLLPSIEKLIEMEHFSVRGYLRLMHELIRSLKNNNEIKL